MITFLSLFLYVFSLFGYSQYIPNQYLPKQYVPVIKYGGHPAQRRASPVRSRVYQQFQYPPKVELSKETLKRNKEARENKGQFVDWKNYNTVSYCEVCKSEHAGGKCKLPKKK